MRFSTRSILPALVSCLTFYGAATMALTLPQQQDEEVNVRGAFLTTRPRQETPRRSASTNRYTSPNRERTRQRENPQTPVTGAPSTGANSSNSSEPVKGANSTGTKNTTTPTPTAASAIGLGYTFYMRDPVGDAVRVDPTSEFRAGDRIRLVLEPNIDGYLYVFHTENDGTPQMIFPDMRLNGGANEISAHVPYEVPSSREADERLRWFAFDNRPATERLHIFVAREPLAGIPIGAELVRVCSGGGQSSCPWKPSAEIWEALKSRTKAGALVSKSKSYGQAQTAGEREATTRGFGLSQAAPEPSVVRMNVSSTEGLLVTSVDLIHK